MVEILYQMIVENERRCNSAINPFPSAHLNYVSRETNNVPIHITRGRTLKIDNKKGMRGRGRGGKAGKGECVGGRAKKRKRKVGVADSTTLIAET